MTDSTTQPTARACFDSCLVRPVSDSTPHPAAPEKVEKKYKGKEPVPLALQSAFDMTTFPAGRNSSRPARRPVSCQLNASCTLVRPPPSPRSPDRRPTRSGFYSLLNLWRFFRGAPASCTDPGTQAASKPGPLILLGLAWPLASEQRICRYLNPKKFSPALACGSCWQGALEQIGADHCS